MDGCWKPWLLGCVIDWEAWAALGTFAAVFAALWLASKERRERRRSEIAEARFVVSVALIELETLRANCDGLTAGIPVEDRPARLLASKLNQKLFKKHLAAMKPVEIRARLGRLHLLPPELGEALADVLTKTEYVRKIGFSAMDLVEDEDREYESDLEVVAVVLEAADQASDAIYLAIEGCQAFLKSSRHIHLRDFI